MNEASETRAPADASGQRRRLEVLARASSAFSEAVLDSQRLSEVVARELAEATGSACSVRLISADGKTLNPVAWFHSDPALAAAMRTVMQQTASMDSIGTWHPVIYERKTLRLFVAPEAPPLHSSPPQVEFIRRHGFAYLLLTPLVARGTVLGGLSLSRRVDEPAFTDEDEILIRDLATRVALAIDNGRLVLAERTSRNELRQLKEAFEQLTRQRTAELEAAVATTREKESRFRSVFENSIDGILVTDTETGGITSANRAACELFGQSEDELRRRPRGGMVDSSDPRFAAAMEEWKRTGRFRGELFLLRGDGSRFEAEYTANHFGIDGMKGTAMIVRDITTRRTAEHAQARLAAIVNDSEDAIISRTFDGIVTSWNRGAEQIFGYAEEEILGLPISLLFPDSRKGEEAQLTQRLKNGEHIDHFESIRVGKDGREIEASVTLSPIRAPSGELVGVSKIVRDITAAKRIQRELVRAKEAADTSNRELESFSYSVAHDLRAPLRSIDGFSQALLEDYSEKLDEDGRKYLRYVRESAQLMAQLIDDMLTLSRVTRSELRREKVDLSELARATHARLERTEPGRTVEVVIGDGLLGDGDPRLLAVVLENLLGNAWKFTAKRRPARIEFGATTKDGVTAYFVRDNGAGFDMAYASKLFGVFQRLHASTEFEGTGVGLATVQRVAHRHGGRVWAEGKVDDGATFYFTLGEKERIE